MFPISFMNPMHMTSQIPIEEYNAWPAELTEHYSIWHAEVLHEHWQDETDIACKYPKAVLHPHHWVEFPILKGKSIIVIYIEYPLNRVFVKYVGPKKDWTKALKESA